MRRFLAVLGVVLAVSNAGAQEQERKLIDRLLKPDMELKNRTGEKTFTAAGSSLGKPASTATFYAPQKPRPKSFAAVPNVSAGSFDSSRFYSGKETPHSAAKRSVAATTFSTRKAEAARSVADSNKKIDATAFASQGEFRDEGKSQKALSRQNAPMTIEQVRELLNKNK